MSVNEQRTTSTAPKPKAGEPSAILERKIEGHTDFIWSLSVSQDGKWGGISISWGRAFLGKYMIATKGTKGT